MDDVMDLLEQDEVWIDREGAEHRIADMEPRYCANVVRFLERRASAIADHYVLQMVTAPMPSEGTVAHDIVMGGFDRELDTVMSNPVAWLAEHPLMAALKVRAEVDE